MRKRRKYNVIVIKGVKLPYQEVFHCLGILRTCTSTNYPPLAFLRMNINEFFSQNPYNFSSYSQWQLPIYHLSPKPIENFSESKHSSNITPNITHLKTQCSNKFTVNISGFIKVKTQNWDPKTFHNNHHSTTTITIPIHKQQQHSPHPKQSVQNENGLYSNLNLNPTSENKSQTRKKKNKKEN